MGSGRFLPVQVGWPDLLTACFGAFGTLETGRYRRFGRFEGVLGRSAIASSTAATNLYLALFAIHLNILIHELAQWHPRGKLWTTDIQMLLDRIEILGHHLPRRLTGWSPVGQNCEDRDLPHFLNFL